MDYDDMRDMQRREEQGDDYVAPTVAYTGEDFARLVHDQGGDTDAANEIMLEVMERDMARYESQVIRTLQARISFLQNILDKEGIDYES